jgi:hypothetical protein
MSETRKEKAERLIFVIECLAIGTITKATKPDQLEKIKAELLDLCLETPDAVLTPDQSKAVAAAVRFAMGYGGPLGDKEICNLVYLNTNHDTSPDIPTPEPVAVDDIVPGWYWNVKDSAATLLTYVSLDAHDVLRYWDIAEQFNVDMEWSQGRKITWYTAPTPAALMRMCREVVTAEEVPPVQESPTREQYAAFLDDALRQWRDAPVIEHRPDLARTPTDECPGIPPAVEVALRVLESPHEHMPASGDAWDIVRDYLQSHAADDANNGHGNTGRPEPAAIETCGECGHLDTGGAYPRCNKRNRNGNLSAMIDGCNPNDRIPKAEAAS